MKNKIYSVVRFPVALFTVCCFCIAAILFGSALYAVQTVFFLLVLPFAFVNSRSLDEFVKNIGHPYDMSNEFVKVAAEFIGDFFRESAEDIARAVAK